MGFEGVRIIDITVGISPDTAVYPGDPEVSIEPVSSIPSDGYAVSKISLGTHTGTHLDSPSHLSVGGMTVDMLPLSSMMGMALVLDLSDTLGEISSEGLEVAFKRAGPRAQDADILLVRTCVNGPCGISDTHKVPHGLGTDAGRWIVQHRFKLIGIDSLSVDTGTGLDNHRLFMENNVLILENIDLRAVEETVYHFICLPLKLEACDAAPTRAILLDIHR